MELEQRNTIRILFEKVVTEAKKFKKMTGIFLATIYRTIKKINEGLGVQRQEGSGASQKYNSNDKRRVAQLARAHPKWSSAKIGELAAKKGSPQVHRSTVWNTLRRSGYLQWVPRPVPMLTKSHREKRLAWCYANRNRDWSKVIFTDESDFQLFHNKVRERANSRPQKLTPKYGPTLMIWGYKLERDDNPGNHKGVSQRRPVSKNFGGQS